MSWNNTLTLIPDGEHRYTEVQSYFWGGIAIAKYTRQRTVDVYRERWVGGNATSARALKTQLAANADYSDVHMQPQTGGQYHVVAVRTILGEWSEWEFEQYNPDE